MELKDTPYTRDLNAVYREIQRLELEPNLAELVTLMGADTSYGWTEDGPSGKHQLRSPAGANWFS